MAKENNIKVSETNFNVKQIHVNRIKSFLKQFDTVIIHGDGAMFVGPKAEEGSKFHKQFNAGYEVNKAEVVSRAKFSATYNKGEETPNTPEDVLADFYLNAQKEIQAQTKPEAIKAKDSFIIADEVEPQEVKKPSKPKVKKDENEGNEPQ
jgi:hypothetical protein